MTEKTKWVGFGKSDIDWVAMTVEKIGWISGVLGLNKWHKQIGEVSEGKMILGNLDLPKKGRFKIVLVPDDGTLKVDDMGGVDLDKIDEKDMGRYKIEGIEEVVTDMKIVMGNNDGEMPEKKSNDVLTDSDIPIKAGKAKYTGKRKYTKKHVDYRYRTKGQIKSGDLIRVAGIGYFRYLGNGECMSVHGGIEKMDSMKGNNMYKVASDRVVIGVNGILSKEWYSKFGGEAFDVRDGNVSDLHITEMPEDHYVVSNGKYSGQVIAKKHCL